MQWTIIHWRNMQYYTMQCSVRFLSLVWLFSCWLSSLHLLITLLFISSITRSSITFVIINLTKGKCWFPTRTTFLFSCFPILTVESLPERERIDERTLLPFWVQCILNLLRQILTTYWNFNNCISCESTKLNSNNLYTTRGRYWNFNGCIILILNK